jgi:hypothetical protein
LANASFVIGHAASDHIESQSAFNIPFNHASYRENDELVTRASAQAMVTQDGCSTLSWRRLNNRRKFNYTESDLEGVR